jgi:Flp pilus assembly protein TadG
LLEHSLLSDEKGVVALPFMAQLVMVLLGVVVVAYFIKTMVASTVGSGVEAGKGTAVRAQGSGAGMDQ